MNRKQSKSSTTQFVAHSCWGGGKDVEIVFVNDGSSDKTESIISELAAKDPLVRALSFTRNFGKEPALMCGLEHCVGDCAIPIDVDLQDPIDVIPRLVEEWEKGMDLVLAKRIDRSSDSWFVNFQRFPTLDAKKLVNAPKMSAHHRGICHF